MNPKNLNKFQGYVYAIRSVHTSVVKIGITKNLNRRFKKLRKRYGQIEIINTFFSMNYNETEKQLHEYYKEYYLKMDHFNLPEDALEELRTLRFKNESFTNLLHLFINGKIEISSEQLNAKIKTTNY